MEPSAPNTWRHEAEPGQEDGCQKIKLSRGLMLEFANRSTELTPKSYFVYFVVKKQN